MFKRDERETVVPNKMIVQDALSIIFTIRDMQVMFDRDFMFQLNTKEKSNITIEIVRAFAQIRKVILNNTLIFNKFEKIEQKLLKHDDK